MRYLKQSTSVDVPIGPFLDETDGKTAETALTITQPDIRLKKNGGAWAQKAAAQTLSHEEAGWYEVTLDATDTDTVGHLMVAVHESGALPVWIEFTVLETAVYDALFADAAPGYLQPTTAGRTLDVSAGGEAGVDWANVGSQSSSVNLSGSSVGTVASVTAIAADGITASSIAANAIGASELATDAVAEIADGVWDEARSGHVTDGSFGQAFQVVDSGTAQGGGTNTITLRAAYSSGDDRINGVLVFILSGTGAGQGNTANDYNNTTKVLTCDNNWAVQPDNTSVYILYPGSAGATVTSIAGAVWNAATGSYGTAGTFGLAVSDTLADTTVIGTPAGASIAADIATVDTVVDAILVDTGTTLDGRIPAALVGGRMDSNMGAISTDATAADNAEAFFDGTGYAGTGNVIPTVSSVTAIATGGITAGSIAADAIGASELAADAVAEIQSGLALSTQVDALEAAVIAIEADTQDIQARLPAALTAGGNIKADALAVSGDTVAADNLEAAADGTGYNLGGGSVVAASVTGAVGSVTGNIGGNLVGTLSSTERDAIAAALLDLAAGVETGLTLRQAFRLISAATAGKLSGGGTVTEVIRNAVADSKARITATVDASGNRSAITYDLT